MKINKLTCDACGAELLQEEHVDDEALRIRIPLIHCKKEGIVLVARGVDLCRRCANVISRAYYNLAEEHGRTGVRTVDVSEDWDE